MTEREIKIVSSAIKTDISLSLLLNNSDDDKLFDDYNIKFDELHSLMFKFDYFTGINNKLDFDVDTIKIGLELGCHYLIDSIMNEDYRDLIRLRINNKNNYIM